MALDKDQLPVNFAPFHVLNVCGNRMVGGIVPITVRGHVPILVGQPHARDVPLLPRVWVSAPTGGSPEEWVELVADNHVANEGLFEGRHVWVDWPEAGGHITVFVGGVPVLMAKISDAEQAEITGIELRPLGLDIHGGPSGLHIGKQIFSKNSFKNARVMIRVD